MESLAHSKKDDIPSQTYLGHVEGVFNRAKLILSQLRPYLSPRTYQILEYMALTAAIYHDMGKLEEFSQLVLQGLGYGKMPNHVDAGVAYLLKSNLLEDKLAAALIYAHHIGMRPKPQKDQWSLFSDLRDYSYLKERCSWIDFHGKVSDFVDSKLDNLIKLHNSQVKIERFAPIQVKKQEVSLSLMRIALSVLVEADHYDTAKHYNNPVVEIRKCCRNKERLAQLDTMCRTFKLMRTKVPETNFAKKYTILADIAKKPVLSFHVVLKSELEKLPP